MQNRLLYPVLLVFILVGSFSLAFKIQRVSANTPIYILADGSIDPPTSLIVGDGFRYNFTEDISGEIVILRHNIIIDGNSHTLQGNGIGIGFSLTGMSNVTIWRTTISNFTNGIVLDYSHNNRITSNTIQDNTVGVSLYGILSANNTIVGNRIQGNAYGVEIAIESESNLFYANIFADNGAHVRVWSEKANTWDIHPLGGNYWSNYTGFDQDPSDGIGDTPHTINAENVDHQPLMGKTYGWCVEMLLDTEWRLVCIGIISNSSELMDFHFGSLAFDVSGPVDTAGFCRIALPHSLLAPPYAVTVNTNPTAYTTVFENETLSIIYFTYIHSTQEVIVIPETISFSVLSLFIVVALLLTKVLRARRRRWI